ncbi:MAG: hypothetical protein DCC75_02710 [Proteobacteria bacterium]|nr:MAG: hypothetical protein DCC75_02710 [Pseudomonadota bacterium]
MLLLGDRQEADETLSHGEQASAASNKFFHYAPARAALADRREAKQYLVFRPIKKGKTKVFKKRASAHLVGDARCQDEKTFWTKH